MAFPGAGTSQTSRKATTQADPMQALYLKVCRATYASTTKKTLPNKHDNDSLVGAPDQAGSYRAERRAVVKIASLGDIELVTRSRTEVCTRQHTSSYLDNRGTRWCRVSTGEKFFVGFGELHARFRDHACPPPQRHILRVTHRTTSNRRAT